MPGHRLYRPPRPAPRIFAGDTLMGYSLRPTSARSCRLRPPRAA